MTNILGTIVEEEMLDLDYDPNIKEHVLFIIEDGKVVVLDTWDSAGSDKPGLISCENDIGVLDWFIEESLEINPSGYFVIENCDIDYFTDPFTGEGDCNFISGKIRPATFKEMGRTESNTVLVQEAFHQVFIWGLYLLRFCKSF